MVSAVKRGFGLTRTEDSAMLTVAEMKALRRDVDSVEFEQRIGLHCKKVFDLNEHGFFDGFEFIGSELFEGVVVDCSGDKRDVIVYKCTNRDDGCDYNITVSFDGSVMFGRKIVNIFKHARFGDKFVTDNGNVLIYGQRSETTSRGFDMGVHFLMGAHDMYHVYDNGEYVKGWASFIDSCVVGRLGDDDLDIVKAYVKKELGDKDVDGYMQGFVDGYNNSVIL